MSALQVAAVLQFSVILVGILLNGLLLYLILRFTKANVGFYKWLMASFCFYEFLYGIAALLVMPVHFVAYRSWIAFSYYGPLTFTNFGVEITSFYCMLYGSWLGFVLCNYIYRYLSLCKDHWLEYISQKLWLKLIFYALFAIFLSGTTYCAYYSCRVHKPTQEVLDYIHNAFGLDTENMSFIMVRIQDPETGEVSPYGLLSISIHVAFLLIWLGIIIYCSVKIYERIIYLQTMREQNKKTVTQEKQLFLVLILQTIIPLLFCGVPSIVHFTFALWEQTAFFSPFSPFFTFASSIPKLLDPLVALIFIQSYRNAILRVFKKDWSSSVHSVNSSNVRTDQETRSTRGNSTRP